jgi:hypothetical protein
MTPAEKQIHRRADQRRLREKLEELSTEVELLAERAPPDQVGDNYERRYMLSLAVQLQDMIDDTPVTKQEGLPPWAK